MPEPVALAHALGTFDEQARHYDARAGLPTTVGAAVARAIVDRAGAGPDELVVELGAGTGEIGLYLSRLPIRYLGLDDSTAMLEVFRAKGIAGSSLAVADCNQPWPLPDGSAVVIFASRVIHLLDPEHVVREAIRVGRPAGFLILGRVLRERDSTKERLRRRRQELLLAAGITPRQGEAGTRHVIARCLAAGGEFLGREEVAAWTGETTPASVLAGWATLARIGSVPVDQAMLAKIVAELQEWARAEIGDLDRPAPFRERYAIDVVRLP